MPGMLGRKYASTQVRIGVVSTTFERWARGLYTYRAQVVAVHDGDTVTVDVDLGFRTWRHDTHVRLAGISARELTMPGGEEAAVHLEAMLLTAGEVIVRSIRTDRDPADTMSFDRYVIAVQLPDGRDLATLLVTEGWAVWWDGKTKPVPYPPWPIPSKGV